MKKKKNSGEETLRSIRRNSAYSSSRVLALITSVVFALGAILISYSISYEFPQKEKIIALFIGVLLGGVGGACLFHFLHAHYDQSDSLIQIAKFQERSLRKRNDALSLVEKIREEVEEENPDKTSDLNLDLTDELKKEKSDEVKKESENSSELSEKPNSAT